MSYSHADEHFVDALVPELRGHLTLWIDKVSLLPGVSLLRQIAANIDAASYVLVVLSKASVQSEWVRKEVAIADSQGVKIIGLRVDDCSVPSEIAYLPFIDFFALGTDIGIGRLKQMLETEMVVSGKVRLIRFRVWGEISADFTDDYRVALSSTPKDSLGSGGLVLDESMPLPRCNSFCLEITGSSASSFDGYSKIFPKMLKLHLENQPIPAEPASRRVGDSPEWVRPGDGQYLFAIPTTILQAGFVHRIEVILGRGRLAGLNLSMSLL